MEMEMANNIQTAQIDCKCIRNGLTHRDKNDTGARTVAEKQPAKLKSK